MASFFVDLFFRFLDADLNNKVGNMQLKCSQTDQVTNIVDGNGVSPPTNDANNHLRPFIANPNAPFRLACQKDAQLLAPHSPEAIQ